MAQPNKGKGRYSEVDKKVIWGKSCHNGHPCCKKCGTKKIRHKGGGLCVKCYDKSRAKQTKRKAQLKKNHDKWYAKVKGTPEYVEYTNARALEWSHTSAGHGAHYRAYQKKRLINHLAVEHPRKKGYITIICSCCLQECVAPFYESDLPNKEPWLMMYRKMLIEKHQSTHA